MVFILLVIDTDQFVTVLIVLKGAFIIKTEVMGFWFSPRSTGDSHCLPVQPGQSQEYFYTITIHKSII